MALSDKVYIRIKPLWLSVKNVSKNLIYEDIPQVAIKLPEQGTKKLKDIIIGFGKNAEAVPTQNADRVIVLNGFEHPRTIINDLEIAEKTLKRFFKEVRAIKSFYFGLPPILIFHPLERIEGGITPAEAWVLESIGKRIGASKTFVWDGRDLTDPEILKLSFPDGGKLYGG